MGRITINGTQAGFSCKKEVSLALWDVKTNRAKGKSEEARTLNQELDNIKAQITRHYQYICDHDSFVTAKKVYNRYVGFSEECHYQNFYEFPKFRIKLLILILLHFNIVRIIY